MKIIITYKLFALVIFLLLLAAVVFVFNALKSQNEVILSEEHRFRSAMLAIELFQSSEDLTRMARSYVSTGKNIYKEKYFEILDIRNGRLPRPQNYPLTYWHLSGLGRGPAIAPGEKISLKDLMEKEHLTDQETGLLRESQNKSDYLVNLEKKAFAAMDGLYDDGKGNFIIHRKPDSNYAVKLLISDEYANEKAEIMTPIQQFMDMLNQRTKTELEGYQSGLQENVIFALVSIIAVGIVVLLKINHMFRRILHPIKNLGRQVAEIASGNYSARCEVLSGNEIGELCINFNNMADFIQKDRIEVKKAEEAMRESEEKFRIIFEQSSTAMAIIEKDTTISMVNKEYCKIGGYEEKDVIGLSWTKQIPPEDLDRLKEYNRKRLINPDSAPEHYEFKFYRKNGEIRDAIISVAFIPSNQKIICSFTDITELKRMEYQLNERIKELNAFYNLAEITEKEGLTIEELFQEFINIFPKSWQFTEICCARIKIDSAEFKTENFKESAWMQSAQIKVYGRDVGSIEVGYLEEKPEEDEGPFLKEERLLINTIAERLGRIKERNQAEEELRKLHRAIEQSPASVVITDANGVIEYINPKFIQITGYSLEEVIGKNPRILKSGEKSYEEYKKLWDTITSGREWHGEFHNKKKNGDLYWESAIISPVMNKKGIITHFLGVKEDITDRKKTELELKQLADGREVLINELQTALSNVRTLQGLIPICANCKKIRDDRGFWNQVEGYISSHTDAKFSHGLCPDCAKLLYGDLYKKTKEKSDQSKNKK